ncbi:TetR/AcrR family transcriptional regulator [Bacillus sp. Bva_UNVM-123]|uniref:TetR/AcrR family transcriptional regulator n=1 Tax=Bacillus sp. Bva_UNVM-123 TaxID=2829798 RepID=UPI00391EFD5C
MPGRDDDQLVGTFPYIPKQERAQKKREALLESGRFLFLKNGYEQTTAKDIASHAGVATGTFYRYFNDKRQLLLSIFGDQLEKLLPPVPDWFKKNPELFLASLLDKHYKRLNEIGIDRVIPELLPKDPELSEVISEARRNLHARIRSGLVLAQEKGLTWKDLDLDTVTWAIILIIEHGRKKVDSSEEPLDLLNMAKVICRLVFSPDVLTNFPQEAYEEE